MKRRASIKKFFGEEKSVEGVGGAPMVVGSREMGKKGRAARQLAPAKGGPEC